jgi:hypothetical protein
MLNVVMPNVLKLSVVASLSIIIKYVTLSIKTLYITEQKSDNKHKIMQCHIC